VPVSTYFPVRPKGMQRMMMEQMMQGQQWMMPQPPQGPPK
jgi:hypothetical protein